MATRDTLWDGRLVLWQPERGRGYRFNLDPVLLAGFAGQASRVLDLGTGCGVIALLLLASGKADEVIGVERQLELAELARKNADENGLDGRFRIVSGDLRSVALPEVDAVVFNPPYFRVNEGRGSPDAGRDEARHERHGGIDAFVRAAAARLAASGAIYAIVPSRRADDLDHALGREGLRIVRRREVVPRRGQAAGHVLVEARRQVASIEPVVEPPLIVHGEGDERFSDEVRTLLAPPRA